MSLDTIKLCILQFYHSNTSTPRFPASVQSRVVFTPACDQDVHNAFIFPILLCSVKLLAPTRLFTMGREENKTLLPIANNVQLLVCEIITEIAPQIEDKKTAVCGHVTSSKVSFCSVVCAFSQFQVYLLDSSLCLLF